MWPLYLVGLQLIVILLVALGLYFLVSRATSRRSGTTGIRRIIVWVLKITIIAVAALLVFRIIRLLLG